MQQRGSLVTPEAVGVEADFAGLGSRLLAAVIDGLIQGAFLLVLALGVATSDLGLDATVVLLVIGVFVTIWVYPIVFEAAWAGQTPGKRAGKIRVLRTDGQPVRLPAVLVRNLLRIVDLLPGVYALGSVLILTTRRAQRLGDLAAGTIVVHETPAPAPQPILRMDQAGGASLAPSIDVVALTPQEYALARSFLARRDAMTPEGRARVAVEIAARLRERVGADPAASAEAVLEAIVVASRERPGG